MLITVSAVLPTEWNVLLLSGALFVWDKHSFDALAKLRARCVLVCFAAMAICSSSSTYIPNSIATSTVIAEVLLVYLVCTRMPNQWIEKLFWTSATILIFWEAVAITHGIWNVHTAKELGLGNLTPFRRIILTSASRQVVISSRLLPILYPLAGLRLTTKGDKPIASAILLALLVGAALYTTLTLSITAFLSYIPLATVCLWIPWRQNNHWAKRFRIAGRVCVLALPFIVLYWLGWSSTFIQMIHPTETISRSYSIGSRITAEKLAWDAFCSHPVLGIGPGNFPLYAQQQTGQNYPPLAETYNTMLRFLAELGICAIVFLAAVLLLVARAVSITRGTIRAIVVAELLALIIFSSGEDLLAGNRWVYMGLAIVAAVPLGDVESRGNTCQTFEVRGLALLGVLYALGSILTPVLRLNDIIASLEKNSVYSRAIVLNQLLDPADVSHGASTAEETLRIRYDGLVAQAPGCDLCWHNASLIDAILGKDRAAKAAIEQAIKLAPDNYVHELSAGLIENHFGRAETARRHFAKAIELRPALIQSNLWSKIKSATPVLAKASEGAAFSHATETRDPIAHARFGQYLLLRGDARSAKRELTISSTSLPTLPVVWQELAYIAAQEADWSSWRRYVARCQWIRGTRSAKMLNNCYQDPAEKLSFDITPIERAETVYSAKRRVRSLLIPRDYTTDLSIVFK